jgi:hypothetical protein
MARADDLFGGMDVRQLIFEEEVRLEDFQEVRLN